MTPAFKQQLIRYWLGLNAAAIQGGAVAAKAFVTLAGANAAGVAVPTLNLQQTVYVFLGGAIYHFLDYLSANPLPMPLTISPLGMSPEEIQKYWHAETATYRIPSEKIVPQSATPTEKPNP
jgi:hypothetical protein